MSTPIKQPPRMRHWQVSLLVLALLLPVAPVLAHHSAAMFDNQQSVTLTGTVKQFQWSNPHCWIQLLVSDKTGPVEWSVEMGSPSQLYRGGWRPSILHAGDPIVVVVHPMRDGSKGGLFVSATHGDGTPFAEVPKQQTTAVDPLCLVRRGETEPDPSAAGHDGDPECEGQSAG